MTDRYCLQYGRLCEATDEDFVLPPSAVIFQLSADGTLQETAKLPPLEKSEGFVAYAGDFYVEPLEIRIEFLKAGSARKWLEALVLRHAERVHQVPDGLWVIAEMEEVSV